MMIVQSASIDIDVTCNEVFAYVADLGNDRFWRSEVNGTSVDCPVGLGSLALEDSRLSKRVPSFLRRLICTEFVDQQLVEYRSAVGEPYFLRSVRTFRANERGGTSLTYHLEFDSAVVRFALGFPMPRIIINWVTRTAMRRYLKILKGILEA